MKSSMPDRCVISCSIDDRDTPPNIVDSIPRHAVNGPRVLTISECKMVVLSCLSFGLLFGAGTTSAKVAVSGHSPRQPSDVVLQEFVLAFEFIVILLHLVDLFGKSSKR